MFYIIEIEDHIRVEPRHFGLPTKEAVEKQLNESYVDNVTKELGYVISIVEVKEVSDGVLIPGDGAPFYKSVFKVLAWRPELHEVLHGSISEITNFGAFMQIGPMQGMIHISQTMEDYVSLNKTGTLSGKTTKRSLAKGDNCKARVVAISFKSGTPKIGLTMRQPGLGKNEWLNEEKIKAAQALKRANQRSNKESKKGGKK